MRLPQDVRRRSLVVVCTIVIGGLALSASHFLHLGGGTESQTDSPRPHSVDLKWNPSASRVAGYNVYRSEEDGGPYTKLTSSPVRETTYTDRTVQGGHTYFYKVTAVDDKGHESLYSNQFKAVVPSP